MMIIRSRLLACVLLNEWLALPFGFGASLGSGTYLLVHGVNRDTLLQVICFLSVWLVGVWRPMHQRLKIGRGDWVYQPGGK